MDKQLMEKLIMEASQDRNLTEKAFSKLKRKYMHDLGIHGLPSNMKLLPVYHELVKSGKIKDNQELEQLQ